jgi:putative glycosyltransferase (TIGR04372 family)
MQGKTVHFVKSNVLDACRRNKGIVWGYELLRLVAGAIVLLCLRLVSPLVKVRIGFLMYDRIGHLAANTEYWVRKEYPKRLPTERFILLSSSRPANQQLVDMFKRIVPIIESSALYSIMNVAKQRWPGLSVWLDLSLTGTHDFALWSNSKTQLAFTDEEMLRGRKILRTMGVPDGAPYVCFAIRDKAYLENIKKGESTRYHDYRDADIENCRLMVEWLTSKGIWAIRIGAVVGKPFLSDNTRIIDYASHYRSDFGDIFLLGNCKFFVGDTAGIFWPAAILGVPVALTNLVPITHLIPIMGSMVMVKRYRRLGESGFIPYRDIVKSGIGAYLATQEYENAGIELVENTPEEILAMAQEMNARIDGDWNASPEDEALHDRFQSIFPTNHPEHGNVCRIPIGFLKANRALI